MRNVMKGLLSAVSAIAIVSALSGPVAADQLGTSTSQTATHADASTFWVGQANGATSCNAVSQTSASDTVTIPAQAGQYAYITEILVQFSTDATGATAVPTISFTNIGNAGGVAPNLSAATTLATTGYHTDWAVPMPVGGLKAAAPGTAVTIVPSGAMGAHSILCMSAIGYYNQN